MENIELKNEILKDKFFIDNSYVNTIYPVENIIWCGKTNKCNEVVIIENKEFGKMLFTDREIQSSSLDENIYHEFLVHPIVCLYLSIYKKRNLKTLILGGGEGAVARELLKYPKDIINHITWVDYDSELLLLSKKYLNYTKDEVYDNERVKIIYEDASIFLKNTKDIFDIIICDLPDPFENNDNGIYSFSFWNEMKNKSSEQHLIVSHLGDAKSNYSNIINLIGIKNTHCKKIKRFIPCFLCEWLFLIFSFNLKINHTHIDYKYILKDLTIINDKNLSNSNF